MSDSDAAKSSRKRSRKRPPVKLTVRLHPQTKKAKRTATVNEDDPSRDLDDHDYASTSCDFCSKMFGDRGKLLRHIRKSHRSGSHVCLCHGREFKTRRSMQLHEQKTQDGTIGQRQNYRKYTHESLMKAYQSVKDGKMATREAARKYGIPFTTLLDRVAGRFEVNNFMSSSGPRPLINRVDEQKLCLHVQFMAAIGYTYLRTSVTQLATELALYKGVLEEGKTLSDNWYRKFVNRWPQMAKKVRGSGETFLASTEIVKKYFEEYVHVLKTHNIINKPENIYCLTVYEVDISQLDQKKKRSSNKIPNVVSIILCCNAAGSVMAPFMVFGSPTYTDKLLEGSLPNAQARVSASGEVDSSVFKDYFKSHLLQLLKTEGKSSDGPVVVLYNGHLMHFEVERIEWARKHGVLLFALPPQTNHLKNSLDSELKDLFSQFFKQEAKKFKKKHFGDPLTKYNVCSIVSKVYPQVFTTRILIRFFKNAAVYPANPQVLDSSVHFKDVANFNDAVYDDLESTDAFLEVRLPFPNAANRVLQRRDQMPLQASPRKATVPEDDKTAMRIDWTGGDFEVTVNEHSYVHGLGDVLKTETEEASVKPVISVPQIDLNYGDCNVDTEDVKTADGEVVVTEQVDVQDIHVIETQVVSSVVEVGTSEEAQVVLEVTPAQEEATMEEMTLNQVDKSVEAEKDTRQKSTFVVDPVTKIRYKILFAE